MQVATMGSVNYIGRSSFYNKERTQEYYNITFCDESGNTLDFFADEVFYKRMENIKRFQEVSIIFNIYAAGRYNRLNLIDIVVGSDG